MNRKKKINQILTKRAKKATTKKVLNSGGSSKPRYISKADRAKQQTEESAAPEKSATPEDHL